MEAYLNNTTAAELLDSLPGFTRLRAADAATQDAALLMASIEIDAVRYQGAKTDPDQERAFPRGGRTTVPGAVLIAVLHQADHLLDTAGRERLDQIAMGLASKTVGSLSESYVQQAASGGQQAAWDRLAPAARALLEPFRLRSGKIL